MTNLPDWWAEFLDGQACSLDKQADELDRLNREALVDGNLLAAAYAQGATFALRTEANAYRSVLTEVEAGC